MKYKYFLILIVILLSSSSCRKFLETEPLDSLSPVNYYETEEQLRSALAGVYDRMGRSQTYGDRMLGRMGLDGDEAYYGRSGSTFGPEVYDVSATDANIANNYRFWYDGINKANFLLANIDKPEMDEEERNAIEGEALFLRAFYHFQLVSRWGDIPLMLKPIEGADETNVPRTPAKEVYDQILEDMIKAEGLVKTAGKVGIGGRVNKSAIRGILARVCLYMAGQPINDVSKYTDARKWAKMVMDPDPEDGFKHELNPSYADVFIKLCQDEYDIRETIWEIEFYGNATDAFQETGRVGSNNGIPYSGEDPNYGYSYGYIYPTGRFWHLYPNSESLLSEDERREWSIAPYSTSGTPVVEEPYLITEIYERPSGKWRRELEVVMPKSKNWGPINFPLLRYSDVLLMFAEADNQVNGYPTPEAIEAVNEVRRRAYGKNLPYESLRMVDVTDGGSGYTQAPAVEITGGGGSGATAKAFISDGEIVRVKMLTEGSGYTSIPTITFNGGNGNGAIANALLSNRQASQPELTANQTSSQEAFQELIEDERSRELSFESLRKNDLIRWDKFLTNMKRIENDFLNGDGPIPKAPSKRAFGIKSFQNASERDVLWPFSPREMSLNQSLRPQNPGW